ncbi:MAG: hypothetical protein N2444_08720 [Methylocystis sp.]|nr:hypothetical protein [Methylocystis sp.]
MEAGLWLDLRCLAGAETLPQVPRLFVASSDRDADARLGRDLVPINAFMIDEENARRFTTKIEIHD